MGSVASSLRFGRSAAPAAAAGSPADDGEQQKQNEKLPSGTAAFMATYRGFGELLPAHVRLVDDPFGRVLGGGKLEWGRIVAERWPSLWYKLLQLPFPLNLGVVTLMVRCSCCAAPQPRTMGVAPITRGKFSMLRR